LKGEHALISVVVFFLRLPLYNRNLWLGSNPVPAAVMRGIFLIFAERTGNKETILLLRHCTGNLVRNPASREDTVSPLTGMGTGRVLVSPATDTSNRWAITW
jgi:hypothetical protein